MLQGQLENKRALDLFSGTGALGFEALSQDAAFVTFVEIEKTQGIFIKNNLSKLGVPQKGEVILGDALKVIEKLSRDKKEFDLIFLDPPYDTALGEKAMRSLAQSAIVKKDSLVILECRDSDELPASQKYFHCLKDRFYGDTRVVIYRCV